MGRNDCVSFVMTQSTLFFSGWVPLFFDRMTAVIVTGIIFFVTVAFAGGHYAVVFIANMAILCAVLLQAPVILLDRSYFTGYPKRVWYAIAAFGLFLLVISVQFVMAKSGLVRIFASQNYYNTLVEGIQLIYYLLFFLVCLHVFSYDKHSKLFLQSVSLLAFLVVMVSLFQRFQGEHLIFGFLDVGRNAFGPFIYENNFGAFAVLTAPAAFCVSAYAFTVAYRRWLNEPWGTPLSFVLLLMRSKVLIFMFIAATLWASIYFAQARAPAIVFSLSAILSIAVIWFKTRKKATVALGLLIVILASAMVVLALPVSSVDTFALPYLSDQASFRFNISVDTIKLFLYYPVLGCGLGAFYLVAPQFVREAIDNRIFFHPNNDILELLAETGVIGFAMIASSFLLLYVGSAAQIKHSKSAWRRYAAIQAAIALPIVLIISLTDSHLQLPSITLLLLSQIAILSISVSAKKPDQPVLPPTFKQFFLRSAFMVPLLLGGSHLMEWSSNHFLAQHLIKEGTDLSSVRTALVLEPGNPAFWYQKALQHYQTARSSDVNADKKYHLDEAVNSMAEATRLAPTFAYYWYVRGRYEFHGGSRKSAVESLQQAMIFSPRNAMYGVFLLSVYLDLHQRSFSTQRKADYWSRATQLYERLLLNPTPIEDWQYRSWMHQYNNDLMNKLRKHENFSVIK